MVKPELGIKRVCVACSTRFYDLGKSPAICPKCGTEQPVEQPKLRRPPGNAPEAEKRPKKPVPPPGAEDADLEVEGVEETEEEEDVLEDASDLEDDAIGPDIAVEPETDEPER